MFCFQPSPNLEAVLTNVKLFVLLFELLPNVKLDVAAVLVAGAAVAVDVLEGMLSPSKRASASSAVRDAGLYSDTLATPAICELV